jgi:hypothetical protein
MENRYKCQFPKEASVHEESLHLRANATLSVMVFTWNNERKREHSYKGHYTHEPRAVTMKL